jgi:hypothetical protein
VWNVNIIFDTYNFQFHISCSYCEGGIVVTFLRLGIFHPILDSNQTFVLSVAGKSCVSSNRRFLQTSKNVPKVRNVEGSVKC